MSRVLRHIEPSGREVAVVEEEHGLTMIHGRRDMIMFAVSTEAAGAVGWFMVKHWLRRQVSWAWLQLRPWRWR